MVVLAADCLAARWASAAVTLPLEEAGEVDCEAVELREESMDSIPSGLPAGFGWVEEEDQEEGGAMEGGGPERKAESDDIAFTEVSEGVWVLI